MYRPGDHYVICDMCGFKKHSSECRKNHNGLIVCADTCWEPRHPQEYMVRAKPDKQAVKDPRPEPEDVYVS